ncbi:MAG: ribose 5-phosphate isomerase B [Oscillospiraceae bacterium]|nr:ribose 5-phosphate isomerase B [Oscillospiraceae bacterium]
MKIYIGCDHAGYEMKAAVTELLTEKGHTVEDMGGDGGRVDYPVIAEKVGRAVVSDEGSRGILICGTGIGMSLAANKIKGIRAALCADHFSAKYTRLHNDANVMCMGARTLGVGVALELAELFVDTPFEGGRHAVRVDMISDMEEKFGE